MSRHKRTELVLGDPHGNWEPEDWESAYHELLELRAIRDAVAKERDDRWVGMKRIGDGPMEPFDDTPFQIKRSFDIYEANQ